MKLEVRDDISKQDIMWFFALIAFLIFWTWLVFYSGCLLTAEPSLLRVCK